jgi:hypothetical protein
MIRRPLIIAYSLILPITWLTIGTLGTLIAPDTRLGIAGTVLMFMGVASFISWIFVKRHHRDYTNREYWKLITYCTIWAVTLELFSIFALIVMPQLESGQVDSKMLLFVIPFTVSIDFLFSWLAFRQTGRRVIARYLKKGKVGTNQSVDPTLTGAD